MSENKNNAVTFLPKETYLAVIENSVGANMFRNNYARVDGTVVDITENGELSCAFFVSSVLRMFGLIEEGHAVVGGAVKDMEKCGWSVTDEKVPGAVIVWEAKKSKSGELHPHIGFYIGGEQAISNGPEETYITKHHFTFGETGGAPHRKIERIFIHPMLDEGSAQK